MSTLIKSVCALTFAVWASIAQPGTGKFTAACSLPFNPTGGLKIDQSCGISGSAAANTPEGLQNKAKNNFCATGTPTTVTPAILLSLQQATSKAKVSFGSGALLPKDRSALESGFSISGKAYHEGQLVHLAAFFIETHAADLSSGESVNCDTKEDPLGNDVHMALGTAYGADECTSVTAELSPHFRPGDWKILADIKAKDKTKKPAPISQFPVRITGQLFFDASHKLCSNGKAVEGNPARQSAWEIHPVYKVDVCRNQTLSACEADQADVWIPIKDWKPTGN